MVRMAEILNSRHYPNLTLDARLFCGEDHFTLITLNLERGLRSVSGNETHSTTRRLPEYQNNV